VTISHTVTDAHEKTGSIFFYIEGGLLVLLGLAAIVFPMMASIGAAVLFGWILIASGVLGLSATFSAKRNLHFWWSLSSSALAVVAGLVVCFYPLAGVMVLVMVIATWLTLDGVSSMMIGLDARRAGRRSWGWFVASAFVDWLFAILIFFMGPVVGLLIVGVVLGVDLMFGGMALIQFGATARKSAL